MSSILIVDDSKMINNGLARSFIEDSHNVTQVYTLTDAIAAVKAKEYDYILLDLILPDGEGELLLAFVQKKKSRVIVLTSDRDSFRRERIFSFGVVDYIIKDQLFNEIAASIKQLFVKIESNQAFTVLLVDDSSFIRAHVSQMLTKRGINVVTANNGKEALSILLSRQQVDVSIIDLEMPEMDGLTLLGRMKKNISIDDIPVMILTGSSDSNVIAKVIKNGVWEFSKKPYIIEELLLKVDNMLERLKQSREIEEQRLRFGMYYHAIKSSTLFLRLNINMGIEYMNKPMRDLLHIIKMPTSFGEIIDANADQILHEIKKHMHQSASFQISFGLNTDNTPRAYIFATFSSVVSSNEKVEEVLMIAQDITKLQEYKDKLHNKIDEQTALNVEQKNVMFQQAKMASMGEMIGNIAHQWRQPLNTIGLLVQDLEEAYNFNEVNEPYMKEMVEKSMHQINFMSKTIDDFRNFFQPNKLKKEFYIIDAINETIDIVGKTLQNNRIEIKISGGDTKILFYGYQNELQQVILNLINNAKDAILEKHSDFPSRERWIHIDILDMDEEIKLSISDNGEGIPENILERIFEPYYTTKEEGQGTGVGLYMSKMIIEQNMKGVLSVENNTHGAVFSIVLTREHKVL